MRKTIARAHGEMPSEDRTGREGSPSERRRARSDQPGQNYRQQLLRPREIGGARILGTHGDGGYDFTDYFRALSGGAFQEALAPAGRGGHAHLARRRAAADAPSLDHRPDEGRPAFLVAQSREGCFGQDVERAPAGTAPVAGKAGARSTAPTKHPPRDCATRN